MIKYKELFSTYPALMEVKSTITQDDLSKRIEKAISEKKPIPDDDPIYIEEDEDIII